MLLCGSLNGSARGEQIVNITANDAEKIVDDILSLESIEALSFMDREILIDIVEDYLFDITLRAYENTEE